MVFGRLACFLLLAAKLVWGAQPPSSPSQDSSPKRGDAKQTEYIDWSRAATTVTRELRKRDLLQWSDELAGQLRSADANKVIVALEVFLRAGQPERVAQAIGKAGEFPAAGRPDSYVAVRLLELGWYEQARAWFDTFPALCPGEIAMRGFVGWLVQESGAARAEAWLREKARGDAKRGGIWRGHWERLYWRHLANTGKLEDHVKDLAENVKQAPADAEGVFEYIGARTCLSQDRRPPAAWLAETCRLERALHNFALGNLFTQEKTFEAAVCCYDRSLACPVTDYDREHFNDFSMCSMYVPPAEAETILRRWNKVDLAAACFHVKQLDRAQKLVEELTGKKDGTLDDLAPFLLAGEVQAATGQRVVEGRIKQSEKENQNSIPYWLNRASYYRGRQELEKVEQAYRAAMTLPADSCRSEVVRDYGWFLVGRNRFREAEQLWRDEIKRDGPKEADFWLGQLRHRAEIN
jgi:tetratricopeptide (TPR) repeat protein